MRITQRQVVIALLVVLSVSALIALIYQLFVPTPTSEMIGASIGLLLLIILLITYWRGWESARYFTLLLITLLIGITTDNIYLTEKFSLATYLPPALAMIVAGPLWIIGSSLTILAILIMRSGGPGIYTDPLSILIYMMTVSSMLLARLVTDTAQIKAEESAEEARQALARSEAQAQELAEKAAELAEQNRQQQQLLDLVSTLETPAVALADGVLLAPVVGHVDSRRIADLTQRLLQEVSTQRSRMVILDIAGVPGVDTAVAQALLRTIQAVRLLGCDVTITGISASVAATMTHLGINMAGVRTARTPQEAMSAGLGLSTRMRQN